MVTKEELDKYLKAYDEGHPLISDEEYDRLLEEYIQAHGEGARPFTRQKQSDDVNDIVGTLTKCYGTRVPMREGQRTYEMWLNSKKLTSKYHIMLQPKFDGCSVAVDFRTKRFFTRGDYDDGVAVDVSEMFGYRLPEIEKFAYPGTTAMKFEAIMSHERFHDSGLNLKYRRPRDAVAATFTSRSVEMAKFITLVPLRGYANNRQYIPSALCDASITLDCDDYDSIDQFTKSILDADAIISFGAGEQHYSVDGIVASPILSRDELVYDDPENEVAIKIIFDVKQTKLKSIDYQIGKQGRITPVAILEPVYFGKIKVDHVTLSTLERVVSMELRHNDTVNVMYNIVPYLIDSEHDGDYPIPVPTKCPICGSDLDYVSLRLVRCSNPNCKALKLGSIIRHAEKMKMVGVSTGVLTKLYDAGFVTCIEDLYKIREFDRNGGLNSLEGFGEKSISNLLNSIDKALHEATLPRFLGALAFQDTDERTWKEIMKHVNPNDIVKTMIDGTFDTFIMMVGYIPGIGNGKLQRIVNSYLQNRDEIQSMMQWIPEKLAKPVQRLVPVHGKCAMTGTRDADATRELERIGYEVGSFTRDCAFLIIPEAGFTSAKTEKAKEWNIPIYTLEEFNDWLSNKSGKYPF